MNQSKTAKHALFFFFTVYLTQHSTMIKSAWGNMFWRGSIEHPPLWVILKYVKPKRPQITWGFPKCLQHLQLLAHYAKKPCKLVLKATLSKLDLVETFVMSVVVRGLSLERQFPGEGLIEILWEAYFYASLVLQIYKIDSMGKRPKGAFSAAKKLSNMWLQRMSIQNHDDINSLPDSSFNWESVHWKAEIKCTNSLTIVNV